MTQENKIREINKKVEEGWDKMVRDSKRVSGYNYNQYGEDLLMFTLSEFLTKKSVDYQYQVAVVDGKLPNYIGRAMSQQIKSSTSMFWHKYRKNMYNTRGVYEAEHDNRVDLNESEYDDIDYNLTPDKDKSSYDCIKWVMENELDWYEATIIQKLYFDKWTKKQFMETYGLPNNSFTKDVKKTINKFRKLCKSFT